MKKSLLIKVVGLLAFFPLLACAGFQVVNPSDTSSNDSGQLSFFQTDSNHTTYSNNQFDDLGAPKQLYTISISGSLKENIERIMGRYGFKVIWHSPDDFNFDGHVSGASLPDVMTKLLQPFPLEATLYETNKVMLVQARNS